MTESHTRADASHSNPDASEPPGDAYSVISYLLGGLLVYGGLGWGLDQWLGTTLLLPLGLILGGAGSVYLMYVRYVKS